MAENYILLERVELNASAASVTFSNIPQSGYTDLKIVISARTTRGTTSDWIVISFNGSTSSFANNRYLLGNGTTASSGTGTVSADQRDVGTTDAANNTANTFSNAEVYIPNYLSSNYKSFSSDAVMENNATLAYQQLTAGMWSNTSAINSITLASGAGSNLVQYSTFSLYGLAAVGTTPAIAPKATGGNITTDGTYWIHTFLTSGTFTPATNLTCDYLVVAGGGSGGGGAIVGGGGGAGGYRAGSGLALTSSTAYTVTVGAGGAGNSNQGASGVDSTISTITSTGGGAGGGDGTTAKNGISGGSGGGGSYASGTGGSGTSGQGYAGGTQTGAAYSGAGGGGAGAVGSANPSGSTGGAGGAGSASSISGSSVYYAGGGGGGANSTGGTGGTGGGANGGGGDPSSGASATANLGGGGGGSRGGYNNGGNGGSGIVIVRYSIA